MIEHALRIKLGFNKGGTYITFLHKAEKGWIGLTNMPKVRNQGGGKYLH